MRVFNLAEELEKERQKNKELEERRKNDNYLISGLSRENKEKQDIIIDLVKRISKAIEYIEKYCEDYVIEDSPDEMCLFYNENGGYKPEAKEELLDILRGKE